MIETHLFSSSVLSQIPEALVCYFDSYVGGKKTTKKKKEVNISTALEQMFPTKR